MITYKLYKYPELEEASFEFYKSNLDILVQLNLLSSTIEEIIITDDIENELDLYYSKVLKLPKLTKNRGYIGVAKTVNLNGVNKIYFDVLNLNGREKYAQQIFFEQLLTINANDIISEIFPVGDTYDFETSNLQITEKLFAQWSSKILANLNSKTIISQRELIHSDINLYIDSFKRKIRKLHYQYQEDLILIKFWFGLISEIDHFVRRCFDVRFCNGDFSKLNEFSEIINRLLPETEKQFTILLSGKSPVLDKVQKDIWEILNLCSIDATSENPREIKVIETPKRLFKNSLIDTEPRIVAFIDILGFSAIIEEYDSLDTSNILNELHETLEMAIKNSIDNLTDLNRQADLKEFLEYRMFSDCICLSLPYIEFGSDFHIQFISLAIIVKTYQLSMMEKGFFVRGGNSIGSYYSDKNMIFSGALVNAYKLEQKAKYPIIRVDQEILNRLKKDFINNSKGLLYDKILLYRQNQPESVFLNPYDIIENSTRSLEYLQSSLNDLFNSNNDGNDVFLSRLSKELLKNTNLIYEEFKSIFSPTKMMDFKLLILEKINFNMNKHQEFLSFQIFESTEYEQTLKVIEKLEGIKKLTEWSMGKIPSDTFKYYEYT